MNYMLLIKLLYLADREALRRWGRPITRDRYVAMGDGPVLSRVLDMIRYGIADGSFGRTWTATISSPSSYEVRLRRRPTAEELSEAEENVLDAIDSEFGQWDVWRVVRWMREPGNIPEWFDPEGAAAPIRVADLLKAVGRSKAEIEQIEAELAAVAEMENLAGPC